jgi:uncharacterized protein
VAALPLAPVPHRPYGKSGREVPVLSLAAKFHQPDARPLIDAAIRLGVTYWDTSEEYQDGAEESGIGQLLTERPGLREKLFLETKSRFHDPEGMSRTLGESLARLKTDHIDMFMMQAFDKPEALGPELRAWADKERAAGRIGLFGFSTHKKVVACLDAARSAGWIDGVMVPYNVRLMRDPKVARAVAACREAGVAVTAIKFRALGADMDQGASANRVSDPLKLRALLQSQDIAAVCAYVPDIQTLEAYVAAAGAKEAPSKEEVDRLVAWMDETAPSYCAGCSELCEGLAGGAPISDAARLLMYHRSYGDTTRARAGFRALDEGSRRSLATADFSRAERACPQGLPIARLARDATRLLA